MRARMAQNKSAVISWVCFHETYWEIDLRIGYLVFLHFRGRSYYRPAGSYCNSPGSYRLNGLGKYLPVSPGEGRSGTLGGRYAEGTPTRGVIGE